MDENVDSHSLSSLFVGICIIKTTIPVDLLYHMHTIFSPNSYSFEHCENTKKLIFLIELFIELQTPSEKLERAGHVLRTILLARSPHTIRDRKYHLRTYRRCLVGTEMVDWLVQQGAVVHSRNQAVGMWQALLEEGVIVHGKCKYWCRF